MRVRFLMGRLAIVAAAGMLAFAPTSAWASLATEFTGFSSINEVGVSGMQSSYHASIFNDTNYVPNAMQVLGPNRVNYPHGVGMVPSPGGTLGKNFDQGMLGVKVAGGNLIVKLATGLNPLTGYYYSGWNTWYGQGDLFVAVDDGSAVSHFALLNSWARQTPGGAFQQIDGGHFDDAEAFHVGREGYLVALSSNADVTLTGGAGSYSAGHATPPDGLDTRVYAEGGLDIGDAGIQHSTLNDLGQDWYLQTWTVPIAWLTSSNSAVTIGLHSAASCGNDSIAGNFTIPTQIPEPASALLALLGLGIVGRQRSRRFPRT